MTTTSQPAATRRRFRFGLRSLLAVVTVAAVICGAYNLFGSAAIWGAIFATASILPVALLRRRGRLAYLLSYFSVYGPFLVMATYTLVAIECSHCKATTWTVLPYAPAVVPWELIRRALNLDWSLEWLMQSIALATCAATLGGLTWLYHSGSWWWAYLSLPVALVFFTREAIGVPALIRA
jgi:hypothetical protein